MENIKENEIVYLKEKKKCTNDILYYICKGIFFLIGKRKNKIRKKALSTGGRIFEKM